MDTINARTRFVEDFDRGRERWRKVWCPSDTQFVVGVDLAQSSDFTAIAVSEYQKIPLVDEWDPDSGSTSDGRRILRQKHLEKYDVRHLERLPLGTPYPAIVAHVKGLMAREPLRSGCKLVIDYTGVGRPVGDLFDAAGLSPYKVLITAGAAVTRVSRYEYHVSKTALISSLDARLNCSELRIAKQLGEASALREELADFRRLVTDAGRASYAARTGKHDDLVLAVALSVFGVGLRERGEFSVNTIKGLW